MELTLIFLDSFESELKGKTYNIFRFLDPNSLTIITGTDLNQSFVPYKEYKCMIEFKNNKLKVVTSH